LKHNLVWLRHDVNLSSSASFKALRARYGWEGQGRFWALLELIGAAEFCQLDLGKPFVAVAVAADLGLTLLELEAFVSFLSDPQACGLLTRQHSTVGCSIAGEALPLAERDREMARKRWGRRTSPEVSRTSPEEATFQHSSPEVDETSPEVLITNKQREREKKPSRKASSLSKKDLDPAPARCPACDANSDQWQRGARECRCLACGAGYELIAGNWLPVRAPPATTNKSEITGGGP
jgi:hypothetical protein